MQSKGKTVYNSISCSLSKLLLLCFLLVATISQAQTIIHLKQDRLSKKTTIVKDDINFSFDCLTKDVFAQVAFFSYSAELAALEIAPLEVSTKEENEYGKKIYNEIAKKHQLVVNEDSLKVLKDMLNELLSVRPKDKTSLNYSIYLIQDSSVNAFTAGGYIFINTGLLNYCLTTSELATIVAHEIAHNEKKHINLILKRIKNAGGLGDFLYVMKQLFTQSFNQFNELEADCYAADLVYGAGYDPRAGLRIWQSLAKNESGDKAFKILMSHPYSKERYECLKSHIITNYKNLNLE